MDNLHLTLNAENHNTFDFSQQQSQEDANYLDKIFQQLSQLPREQLLNINFSLGQESIESFGGNAIYVDKTAQILNVMQMGRAFLARPRRMGKTLTISTIQVILSELYQKSIYQNHTLDRLKNTFFAQQYSTNALDSASFFGCPYTVLLTLKDVNINLGLRAQVLQERSLAHTIEEQERSLNQIRDLQKKKSELNSLKSRIEQEFSDSFNYQNLYQLLEQKLLDNPDYQIFNQINFVCDELTPQVNLNRIQVLKTLFELQLDANSSNQAPLCLLNEKQTEIKSRQIQLYEQMNTLDTQLKDLDVKLNHQTDVTNNLEKQIDYVDSKSHCLVNAVDVNSNQLTPTSVQDYESLGQLRRTLLLKLCNGMLASIDKNKGILAKLKTEILTYDPEFQQGLDCIEDQWQKALQRNELLKQIQQEIGSAPDYNSLSFSLCLKKLINVFDTGFSILIDEYDSPLIDQLDITSLAEYVRQVMEEFFVTFKDSDVAEYINIMFVTGVTAYAKVSLFSGANNIYDISYQPGFNNIVGLTEHEIIQKFAPIICKHAILNNCHPREIIDKLALHYDGYYFTLPNNIIVPPIFNTLAVILTLFSTPIVYDTYWSSSGSSLSETVLKALSQISADDLTKVINQALNGGIELSIGEGTNIFQKITFAQMQKSAEFLLYQAGYLTIDFEKSFHTLYSENATLNNNKVVALIPPNLEVRNFLIGELETLVKDYKIWKFGEKVEPLIDSEARKNLDILEQGRLTLILKAFADYSIQGCERSFNLMLGQYAQDINNQTLWENFLRNILFTCIKENINASGNNQLLHAETELPVGAGRIDLIVTNERDKIKFVFEFKRVDKADPNQSQINKALKVAASQINSHNYTNHIGYRVIAIAGAFFRNLESFSSNSYSLGYHICLEEVKVIQND